MRYRYQLDMRENPASSRRHDSRFAAPSLLDEHHIQRQSSALSPPTLGGNHSPSSEKCEEHAAQVRVATGGKKDASIARQDVTLPPSPHGTSSRNFEPLISSHEAARLLGKIHVKTLQRYARHGNLPGYQIGGHWYFRASELDSWLRSRLNSSCHPCRLK